MEGELRRPKWPDRTFRFGHPLWMLADFTERLRGTPDRLAAVLRNVPAPLASADEPLQRAEAYHERLRTPMRLVDLAQFVAEHDDHHLLRIRELRARLGIGEARGVGADAPDSSAR